jgi:hypothetical protein
MLTEQRLRLEVCVAMREVCEVKKSVWEKLEDVDMDDNDM